MLCLMGMLKLLLATTGDSQSGDTFSDCIQSADVGVNCSMRLAKPHAEASASSEAKAVGIALMKRGTGRRHHAIRPRLSSGI